jgi:hypothetical protein
MEVGFKPQTPQRGEISMSITALMQPMFLPWLHRSNGVVNKKLCSERDFRRCSPHRLSSHACEKQSHGHRDLGGRRVSSNILGLVF